MISAPPPEDEDQRLQALEDLDILDTLEEQAYDDLTRLAAHICDTPIALVSLVDQKRQWFKSHHGLEARETPREYAFCSHAILGDGVFVVEDADNDERFTDNPLVTGEPHVKFYAGFPLSVGDARKVGTLCIIDNHARKLSEVQKQALEALSRQVISQLELRLKIKQLTLNDKAKDDFVSSVSHELRTPLTAIGGSLALLSSMLSDRNSVDVTKMLDVAQRNNERLLALVNDILDAAKMSSGKFEIHPETVNIAALINEAAVLNIPYVERCDCKLEVQIDDGCDDINVYADTQRLIQVICNLVSNAAKFSDKAYPIILKLHKENDNVCMSVINHGAGITEEQKAHLFDRFTTTKTSANLQLPGTGLGLSICKSIIDSHNGIIAFDNAEDNTTRFYFCLPIMH